MQPCSSKVSLLTRGKISENVYLLSSTGKDLQDGRHTDHVLKNCCLSSAQIVLLSTKGNVVHPCSYVCIHEGWAID